MRPDVCRPATSCAGPLAYPGGHFLHCENEAAPKKLRASIQKRPAHAVRIVPNGLCARLCVGATANHEREIPLEKRQTEITPWDEVICEGDDPRWIASERELLATFDAEIDAACALCDVGPTTRQGLSALLNYALTHDSDGHSWPSSLESGDERNITGSWHYFLIENVLMTKPLLLTVCAVLVAFGIFTIAVSASFFVQSPEAIIMALGASAGYMILIGLN